MKKFLITLFFLISASSFVFASSSDLERALNLLNEGKTDEAMEIVKTQILKNPESSGNYLAMGMIQLEKRNYTEAKENLKQALKINRKLVAAHYMLAMIYEKEGNAADAVQKWKNIVKYSKNDTLKALAEKHIKQLEGGIND